MCCVLCLHADIIGSQYDKAVFWLTPQQIHVAWWVKWITLAQEWIREQRSVDEAHLHEAAMTVLKEQHPGWEEMRDTQVERLLNSIKHTITESNPAIIRFESEAPALLVAFDIRARIRDNRISLTVGGEGKGGGGKRGGGKGEGRKGGKGSGKGGKGGGSGGRGHGKKSPEEKDPSNSPSSPDGTSMEDDEGHSTPPSSPPDAAPLVCGARADLMQLSCAADIRRREGRWTPPCESAVRR